MLCSSCNEDHPILDPAFIRPDPVHFLKKQGDTEHLKESDDICSILSPEDNEATRHFLRALIPCALTDCHLGTAWGIWIEISEKDLQDVVRLWDDPDQASHPPFTGKLANQVPGYPTTLGLDLSISLTGPTTRPEASFPDHSSHPFAQEIQDGVSLHRLNDWLTSMGGKPKCAPLVRGDEASGRLARNLATFLCSHVLEDGHPVLYTCFTDGEWQFLCGGAHEDSSSCRIVSLGHVLDGDFQVGDILDLPEGWGAERDSLQDSWVRFEVDPEEEEG